LYSWLRQYRTPFKGGEREGQRRNLIHHLRDFEVEGEEFSNVALQMTGVVQLVRVEIEKWALAYSPDPGGGAIIPV
jgi:hypothetical protein